MSVLLSVLVKLRDETIIERDAAANPPLFMDEADYSSYNGRELALDEIIYKLNKLIQENS
jgi:hypothetical protein